MLYTIPLLSHLLLSFLYFVLLNSFSVWPWVFLSFNVVFFLISYKLVSPLLVSGWMLGTGRGKSHVSSPCSSRSEAGLVRNLLEWPFHSIRPSVLMNECVKGMTFMKLMVLFHALNSGLTFFSSHYLFFYHFRVEHSVRWI